MKTGRVASNLDDSIGLCIVPVKLFYKDSQNFVKTFALLDNGSQGTFIDTDFLQEIDACSTNTSLSIKTIHGERTERCRAVDDLVVSPVYDDSIRIHLPRTYSQSDLPVNDEDVPTKERLRRWKYLKPISSFLPSSSQNIKVGLLIGSNCPQALEPLDTIASQNNGPFAYRTRLGWCVSGPIHSSNLSSNTPRLSVNQTGRPTTKSLSCFRNQTKVNEVDLNELDKTTIEIILQQRGGEWMRWKRNPPASIHMGGAWERLIRSARSIFSSLIYNHGLSLNNEAFLTLLVEIEAIINSRPLTDTLSDDSELPLSPINLLTMKSRVVLPPPGNYSANDLYSRRRWRRVQHIANEFWSRWRKEYLQTLQRRSKWQHKTRNFSVGDVVLLKESNFRNDWQLARIMDVFKDENNVVRSCQIRTQRGLFDRPIHKLVLLVEADRTDVESE